jgi:uncharacterized protein YgbK (DUF1537 family)
MAATEEQVKALKEKARTVRIDILKMLTECGSVIQAAAFPLRISRQRSISTK